MLCNSWIIVRRDTGKPVFETWTPEIAAAINREAYDVLTAHAWLVRLNQSIKAEV